jgi:glucosamine--fructose-6-phosphate aminotransferase (isomerizing)
MGTQSPQLLKDVGKISDSQPVFPDSNESFGHTRWATHGAVRIENTHPHQAGRTTLVHNGIFENYQEHKTKLEQNGYEFVSQTDSEVLAALIDHEYDQTGDVAKQLANIAAMMTGRSAIIFSVQDQEGIYALSTGLPLVIGYGSANEMHIASDTLAFRGEVDEVVYLARGYGAYVSPTHSAIYSLETAQEVFPTKEKCTIGTQEIDADNHEHYMLKEIEEQPTVLLQAATDIGILQAQATAIHRCSRVYLIGCGTAHKVAMLGAYVLRMRGVDAQAIIASEVAEYASLIDADTICMAISQSGETADVLQAVESLCKRGASISAITNVPHSSLARFADFVLPIGAGVEQAVASTKAASNQIAIVYALSELVSGREIGSAIQNAASRMEQICTQESKVDIQTIASSMRDRENLFIIGSGNMYPLALEGAIKIAEVSYIHAQGFATAELKHGPLALVEEGTVCIVLGSQVHDVRAAAELRARGAYIIGVAPTSDAEFDVHIPTTKDGLAEVLSSLVVLQLLSYYLATARSINPDRPRNLAKSVTVQ